MDRRTRKPSKEKSSVPRRHSGTQQRPVLQLRKNRPHSKELLVKQLTKNANCDNKQQNYLPQLIRIPVIIKNRHAPALIDTRSAASFISTTLFSSLSENEVKPLTIDVKGFVNASGGKIDVEGKFELPVTLKNEHIIRHPFYVVSKLVEPCIFGLDFVITHKLTER